MWQVIGFEPNASGINTETATVSADSLGRIKRVSFKAKFGGGGSTGIDGSSGTHQAFYPGDSEYGEREALIRDYRDGEVPAIGDWIRGRGGEIAQILDMKISFTGGKWWGLGYTIFGCNNFSYQPVNLAEDRVRYGSLSTMRTNGLSRFTKTQEQLIGSYVLNNFDPYLAYELTFRRKINTLAAKGYAKQVVKKALATKKGSAFFLETIKERLTKTGIDPAAWIQKLIDSVPEAIQNETQRKIWETIGMLEPSIRKELLEARGEIEPGGGPEPFQVPGSQKQITEASFTECDICHGNKKYIARTESGQEFEAICPKCSVQKQGVPEEAPSLRL